MVILVDLDILFVDLVGRRGVGFSNKEEKQVRLRRGNELIKHNKSIKLQFTGMDKKVFITIGLIAIIAIGVFFYLNQSDKKHGVSQLETVKVAQFNEFFLYMPLYLADAKGFFAEEGLKIEIINTGGDDKTFAAVIGGSATFGIADPTFVAIAREQGMGGKVICLVLK